MTDKINLIRLQNKVDLEFDQALELIKPIVCNSKKLTLRETKKAQILLKEHGLDIHVYLDRGYFTYLKLLHSKRSIKGTSINGEYSHTMYINDDTRSIMLDRDETSLSSEELEKYSRNTQLISTKEIKKNIKDLKNINDKIDALKSQKYSIKYKSYLE